ncbi:MAG TPA: hypothetical protein VEI97_06150 [bacterium]|nr:hypothetical protein [bacterium]
MARHYVLDEAGEVVGATSMSWALWFETHNRQIALDEPLPGVQVSTVFLGLDHQWDDSRPPLIYETMTFGYEGDGGWQLRYSTREEALAGHALVISALVNELPRPQQER